ncbi:MAG: DUF1573 domain-containing protein [Armatimonadetes bacterium]|nr:DUF1573 domain-containing protein [Armatimonadota bacterium]
MRKALLTVALLCLVFDIGYLSAAARAARPVPGVPPALQPPVSVPPAEGPLQVDQADRDLGSLDSGDRKTVVFRLRNRGNQTVRIERVDKSCGCTRAAVTRTEIPPAGETELQVTYEAARSAGPFRKTVTVRYNSPEAAALPVTVSGRVAARLRVDPRLANLGTVRVGESASRSVTLTPLKAGVVLDPPLPPTSSNRSVEVGPLEPLPDGSYRLVLTARPRDAGETLDGVVVLHTGDRKAPQLLIHYSGAVLP